MNLNKETQYYKDNMNDCTNKLRQCQSNKNVNSCLKCKEIIGCKIRMEYVESVYSSMNKGGGGFFNFEA